MADRTAIAAALKASGFKNIKIESEIIKMHFTDMLAIIQWLRHIGANALPRDIYIGRDWLLKANEYYKENFNDRWGVYASFEVIWIEARK